MSTFKIIKAQTASRHRSITPFGSGAYLITGGYVDDNFVNVGVFTEATSGLVEKSYVGSSATDPYNFVVSDAVSGVWLVKKDNIYYVNDINSFT